MKLLTPPSRTKTKDLFINLRFNSFKVFPVRVEFFFRPFRKRSEARKKVRFWKEPQRRPYTIINFSPSQNCQSVFPLHCAMSRIFYFAQCPKCQGGVNNFRVTLVHMNLIPKWFPRRAFGQFIHLIWFHSLSFTHLFPPERWPQSPSRKCWHSS